MTQASKAEIKTTLSDRDFWYEEIGSILGWQLFGWTYRSRATFLDQDGEMVEVTAAHVELVRAAAARWKDEE